MMQTKEIVDAAALGKVLTSSVRGTDSSLLSLSDRLRYSDDPDVGQSPNLLGHHPRLSVALFLYHRSQLFNLMIIFMSWYDTNFRVLQWA